MDKNKLKALSKDSLLQKLENYPTWAETGYKEWQDC
jgi:hypothetical protein